MNCFVMLSQLIVVALNNSPWFLSSLLAELDTTSCALLKVILSGYGFWNLDYFHYLIPPFCLSQGLKNIHVLALQYVSAFYPLLLIALTYACVELHGHNFRPIVWLGNHFTDIASMLDGGGIQKHPLLMSLPRFLFCLTLSFCLCQLSFS